jgi:hypothetical protein
MGDIGEIFRAVSVGSGQRRGWERFAVIAGRRRVLVAGVIVLLLLAGTSKPLRVGDARDYMALALRLADRGRPAMYPEEIKNIEARMDSLGGFSGPPLESAFPAPALTGKDGRVDLEHFWFYSMLAVPEVWMLEAVGLKTYYAFTLLNIGLLLTALWVASSRLEWPALTLLFLSPIIWWIDKAHTEIFTFSMLTIAMTLIVERPWWALVCAGLASTQNTPIAFLLPLIVLTAVASRPAILRDWRFYLGGVVAAPLAALHPLYYELRLHVASPEFLWGGLLMAWPSRTRYFAILSDLNFGLFVWCPLLVAATGCTAAALIAWDRKRMWMLPALASAVIAAIFMFSFAQFWHLNVGGTFGMHRYAVWLIPLAIPILAEAQVVFSTRFNQWLAPVAIAAAIWSVSVAHPRYAEQFLAPTWLAERVWTTYPSLDNPLVDVFSYRVAHRELGVAYPPLAVSNCAKILLVGGRAPVRCFTAVPAIFASKTIPAECFMPSALCYANRTSSGYDIVEAPL